MALQRVAHALAGAALLGWLVDEASDDANRGPRLVVLIDELRGLYERRGEALAQHEEGEECAGEDRVVRRQREIDAEREAAAHHQALQRRHDGLDQITIVAFFKSELCNPRRQCVPFGDLPRLERQGLDGADALNGLRQEGATRRLGTLDGAGSAPITRQHEDDPTADQGRDRYHHGRQDGAEEEHNGHKEQKDARIQYGAEKLSHQELPHAADLPHFVHR